MASSVPLILSVGSPLPQYFSPVKQSTQPLLYPNQVVTLQVDALTIKNNNNSLLTVSNVYKYFFCNSMFNI